MALDLFQSILKQLRERTTQNKIDLSEFSDLTLYKIGRVEDSDCFDNNCFDVTDYYKDASHKAWDIAYGKDPCNIKEIPIPNQPMYMGWSDPMGLGSGGYMW